MNIGVVNRRPQIRSKKEIAWERKQQEVNGIADRLGKGIDEGIKETIVALLMYRFSTTASCEGHLDRGCSYPWVEIETPAPKGWKRNKGKQREWRIANLKQRKKMMELLRKFYESRDTPFDAKLSFASLSFGTFHILSMGAELTPLLSSRKRKQKLNLYRKEMRDFTVFLSERYLRAK
jgi:hypothetical protein